MKKTVKLLTILCRILLGLVFIFSGFVKGVDPMGSAIKFAEYFDAFHIPWLDSMSLILSIVLSTVEFLIGIALVTGLRMEVTSRAAVLFMGFFTILTLYSVIWNPVSDCGCFGDALILTNWQTFCKNIILIILALIIFYRRKTYVSFSSSSSEWTILAVFLCFVLGISFYSLNHLPIVNFRPYTIGTHIPSKMVMPEGVQGDVYETTLFYEKNHQVKSFTLQNFPWKDTTWKFKEQKSVLVKKGYTPPIHGFSITSAQNEDISQAMLQDTSYSFVFISVDLLSIKKPQWQQIKEYEQAMAGSGKKFYLVTSSTEDVWEKIRTTYQLPFEVYYADPVTLKTIMRANPGLMLLKDGVILGLWHYHDIPPVSFFKGNILSDTLSIYQSVNQRKSIFLLAMILMSIFLCMLIYSGCQSQNAKHKA